MQTLSNPFQVEWISNPFQWTQGNVQQEMTEDERIFWRMQRYAKPWPPDWLSRVQDVSNPVVFFDVAIRALDRFLIQGGDFVKFDGTGCYSIFGGARFADENLTLSHTVGSVSMANAGEPNSNGCQFFIVTMPQCAFLDGIHVVVGQVIDGMDTVTKMEEVPTVGEDFRPLRKVIIEECGQLL